MRDVIMLWSWLLLLSCVYVALGRTPQEEEWFECHGMERAEYEATKRCMRNLRYQNVVNRGRGQGQGGGRGGGRGRGQNASDMSDDVVSGDVIYTLDQCERELNNIHRRRRKRKIIDFSTYGGNKWPLPILYEYHADVDSNAVDKVMIEAAMAHWEAETCIRFELFDPNIHGTNPDRIIYTAEDNCYSYIGKVSSVIPQQVNLESAACTATIGIPVHELGHAIGFFHEQSRPDRDQYVTLHLESVDDNRLSNFDETTFSTDHGCPYDYGSIMHYGRRDFSTTCEVVLEATEPYTEYTMGQRGHLSFIDSKIANIAYCADSCAGSPPLSCENGGYQDPNDCSKCRCPEGFGGTLCDDAGIRVSGCNPSTSMLEVTEAEQCVSSPGYDSGIPYSVGDECNWILKAPDGCNVMARFEPNAAVYCRATSCRGPDCFHWAELKYKADKTLRGGRFCCNDDSVDFPFNRPAGGWVTSEDETMVVHFDGTWPQTTNVHTGSVPDSSRVGFKLCFKLDEACTPTTTEATTTEATTTEATTTEATTTEATTTEATTTEATTTEATTTEATTTEATTTEATTTEATTTEATTTEVTITYPYCTPWVAHSACSLPCSGCGCRIIKTTCFFEIGTAVRNITIYTSARCNVIPCDLSNPLQREAYQFIIIRIGDRFFVLRRRIPMPCCFNFCNDPPTYLSPWIYCRSQNPVVQPVCPAVG